MRAMVVACALACAGCELVFPLGGGDDGESDDVADDAPPPPGFCAGVMDPAVVQCADFDTAGTGIGPTLIRTFTATGVVEDMVADSTAPSPPGVLVTALGEVGGNLPSYAIAEHVAGARWHGMIEVWAKAAQPATGSCVPAVIDVLVGAARAQVQAVPTGYQILTRFNDAVVDSGEVVNASHTGWLELRLGVDTATGILTLAVGNSSIAQVTSPQVMSENNAVATASIGIGLLAPHDPCAFTFDNLLIKTLPP
jgi:hypothetical protein